MKELLADAGLESVDVSKASKITVVANNNCLKTSSCDGAEMAKKTESAGAASAAASSSSSAEGESEESKSAEEKFQEQQRRLAKIQQESSQELDNRLKQLKAKQRAQEQLNKLAIQGN